jgi:hypothetical protein
MLDLNQRSVATTDLQSATFNRSANDPLFCLSVSISIIP